MILVAIVDFMEQILILNAKHLILKQCHVGPFIFDLLQVTFLFLMVADELIVFSLLFHQFMINFKKLNFCIKLLRNVGCVFITGASKINESISFNYRGTFYVES